MKNKILMIIKLYYSFLNCKAFLLKTFRLNRNKSRPDRGFWLFFFILKHECSNDIAFYEPLITIL